MQFPISEQPRPYFAPFSHNTSIRPTYRLTDTQLVP